MFGVKNIEQSCRFYQTPGFEQQFALPRADSQLTLAVLNFSSSTLLLGQWDELHYEHPPGLKITLEPVDEFYGDRFFMFLDLVGYERDQHSRKHPR